MSGNSSFTISKEETHKSDLDNGASHSILILMVFFAAIISLFAVGIGCSYLCYKQNLRKRKEKDRKRIENERSRSDDHENAFPVQRRRNPYRAITNHRRGIPNWYSPNPKDENSHLLDLPVVPVHMQIPQ